MFPVKLLTVVFLVGMLTYHWLSAGYIHAKALLAQRLIESSWQDETPGPPWPWADTKPVARLKFGQQDRFILDGHQGNALAFGPGLISGKSKSGTVAIAGHRDTHFKDLQYLELGDQVSLQFHGTVWQTYTVDLIEIVDITVEPEFEMGDQSELLLITCYPFDGVVGGDLRYVVRATKRGPQPPLVG